MKVTKRNLLDISVLIFISSVPYLPGVSDQFVFDDIPGVKTNQDVHNPDPWDILLHDYWGDNITSRYSHKSYRPVTTFTFWLQQNYTNPGAEHYKFINILLHSINTILIYCLVKSIFVQFSTGANNKDSHFLSFSTSCLFGIHPVHVEPVLSIVGRADLLYSLLFLSSSLISISWLPSSRRAIFLKYFLLSLLTTVSMFCKEQGILFLVFFFLTELCKTGFVRKKVLTPKFVIFSFYIVVNLTILATARMWLINFEKPSFQKSDNPSAFQDSVLARFLSFNYLYCLNFTILLCPNWLCFDWAMGCVNPVQSFWDSRIFILIAFWTILTLLAVKFLMNFKKQKHYTEYFALALFIAPFILSMNILVYVGFVIAERNLYLSVAGISLFICKGFLRLKKCAKPTCVKLLYTVAAVVFVSFMSKTYLRSLDWRNEFDLFQSGLNVCFKNAKVHYNIAKKFADQNNIDMAVTFYKESIRLQPDYEHALNNLGNLLKSRKQYKQAEKLLSRATNINPRFAAAFMNLGIVQQAQLDYGNAEKSYNQALQLRPFYPDCEYNLGNLYLKTQMLKNAEERFRVASKHKHELAYINLIILLDQQSRADEAEELAQEALKMFPNNPEFLFQYANLLGQKVKKPLTLFPIESITIDCLPLS